MVAEPGDRESSEADEAVVYVIGASGSNTVKIGTTRNLSKRFGDIQRMSPVPLAVLWTHPGGHDLETSLHRYFKTLRSHGEWFTFRRDPVQLICWAVEDQPWLRPKVQLTKSRRSPGATSAETRYEPPAPVDERRAFDELIRFAATIGDELDAIVNPIERYQATVRAQARKDELVRAASREVAVSLKSRGLTWREVGELMGGISGQRAHQISKYPPLPE